MIKKLMLVLALATTMGLAQATVLLEENFKEVSKLPGKGWIFETRSIPPAASTGWIQGEPLIFDAHTPPPDAYIGSSFAQLIAGSFLDDRLYTQEFSVADGAKATFYLRGEDFGPYIDQVSYGFTDGSGTELSDFLVMETTIVPKDGWAQYTITLAAQGPGAVARLGFRHFGLQDTSNVAGLDTLTIETLEPAAVPEPASLMIVGIGMAGLALTRRRRR